jgi:hypothetical protein
MLKALFNKNKQKNINPKMLKINNKQQQITISSNHKSLDMKMPLLKFFHLCQLTFYRNNMKGNQIFISISKK